MRLPAAAQSAGVPVTVKVKLSQVTPSTQVLSPLADPVPSAVPSQARAAPAGPIDPAAGAAERNRVGEMASRIRTMALIKKTVAAVTRAVIEDAVFFMAKRWLMSPQREGPLRPEPADTIRDSAQGRMPPPARIENPKTL
jgi:hypothetical protein